MNINKPTPLSPKVENQQSVDAEVTDPVKAPFAEL